MHHWITGAFPGTVQYTATQPGWIVSEYLKPGINQTNIAGYGILDNNNNNNNNNNSCFPHP